VTLAANAHASMVPLAVALADAPRRLPKSS
jgi:hypothetical protein